MRGLVVVAAAAVEARTLPRVRVEVAACSGKSVGCAALTREAFGLAVVVAAVFELNVLAVEALAVVFFDGAALGEAAAVVLVLVVLPAVTLV